MTEQRLGRFEGLDILLSGAAMSTAVALAVLQASLREFTLDEYHTWHQARLAWGDLTPFLRGDVHPPLYLWLVWAWSRVFGEGALALRTLSVAFFGAAAAAMYWASRAAFDSRRHAAMAAFLLALSPVAVSYGSHARSYALLMLVAVLLLWAYLRSASHPQDVKTGATVGILSALLFYSHYMGTFFAVGIFGAWFVRVLRSGHGRGFAAAVIFGGILTVAWLPTVVAQRALRARTTERLVTAQADLQSLAYVPSPAEASTTLDAYLEYGRALIRNAAQLMGVIPLEPVPLMLLSALPGALAAIAAVWCFGRGDPLLRLTVPIVVAVVAGALFLGLREVKFLVVLMPVISLMMARGITWTSERRGGRWRSVLGGALVLVYVVGCVRLAILDYPRPFGALVSHVVREYNQGDVIVFHASHAQIPFEFHARQYGFRGHLTGFPRSIYDQWAEVGGFRGWSADVASEEDLSAFVNDLASSVTGSVWLVMFEDALFDPRGRLPAALEVAFGPAREHRDVRWEGHLRVLEFS